MQLYYTSTSRNNISLNYADLATVDCPEMDLTRTIHAINTINTVAVVGAVAVIGAVAVVAVAVRIISVGTAVGTLFGTAVVPRCNWIVLPLTVQVFRMVFWRHFDWYCSVPWCNSLLKDSSFEGYHFIPKRLLEIFVDFHLIDLHFAYESYLAVVGSRLLNLLEYMLD